ncbi:MAG: DUF5592 family protein [Oscillospiraceae bacterium]
MIYIIPKGLKEEFKIFDKPKIYWKDVLTIAGLLMFFMLMQNLVHQWLIIPYWIVAAAVSIYLTRSAKNGNPEKRKWEAIILLLSKNYAVFYSLNRTEANTP